jgi:cobalt-zinc-cadmium efflux system outer membrane protein
MKQSVSVTIAMTIVAMAGTRLVAREQNSFAPVIRAAHERNQNLVAWQRDQETREQALSEVRRLLRGRLTPGIAAQIALLNNRELQATFEEIGFAEADLKEARAIANPRLDVSARFPDKPPSGTDVEWGVVQNFLNILMIPLKARVAKEQLVAAQLRVSHELIKLVAETKSAVYRLQAAEEILEKLRTEQAVQSTSLSLVQKLHEAGNVTDLQLLQQQNEYNQSRVEIAQAEAETRALREQLNRLMGLWGVDTDWQVEPRLPDVPSSDFNIRGLETLALVQRYDLAAAKAELESAVKASGLEKTFRWVGALDFGIDSERQSDSQTITGPTFQFELPLFNQGQARVARAEAHLRKAYAKFEGAAVDIRSEVRELRDKLISARDIAQFYRNSLVPIRAQTRDQMQLQYNAMILSPLELFIARRQEIAADRGYIEAKRDYWVTRSELEHAVGGSLSRNAQTFSKNPIQN